MRKWLRYTVSFSLALARNLLAIMQDIFLLSIFSAHMRMAVRAEESLIGYSVLNEEK